MSPIEKNLETLSSLEASRDTLQETLDTLEASKENYKKKGETTKWEKYIQETNKKIKEINEKIGNFKEIPTEVEPAVQEKKVSGLRTFPIPQQKTPEPQLSYFEKKRKLREEIAEISARKGLLEYEQRTRPKMTKEDFDKAIAEMEKKLQEAGDKLGEKIPPPPVSTPEEEKEIKEENIQGPTDESAAPVTPEKPGYFGRERGTTLEDVENIQEIQPSQTIGEKEKNIAKIRTLSSETSNNKKGQLISTITQGPINRLPIGEGFFPETLKKVTSESMISSPVEETLGETKKEDIETLPNTPEATSAQTPETAQPAPTNKNNEEQERLEREKWEGYFKNADALREKYIESQKKDFKFSWKNIKGYGPSKLLLGLLDRTGISRIENSYSGDTKKAKKEYENSILEPIIAVGNYLREKYPNDPDRVSQEYLAFKNLYLNVDKLEAQSNSLAGARSEILEGTWKNALDKTMNSRAFNTPTKRKIFSIAFSAALGSTMPGFSLATFAIRYGVGSGAGWFTDWLVGETIKKGGMDRETMLGELRQKYEQGLIFPKDYEEQKRKIEMFSNRLMTLKGATTAAASFGGAVGTGIALDAAGVDLSSLTTTSPGEASPDTTQGIENQPNILPVEQDITHVETPLNPIPESPQEMPRVSTGAMTNVIPEQFPLPHEVINPLAVVTEQNNSAWRIFEQQLAANPDLANAYGIHSPPTTSEIARLLGDNEKGFGLMGQTGEGYIGPLEAGAAFQLNPNGTLEIFDKNGNLAMTLEQGHPFDPDLGDKVNFLGHGTTENAASAPEQNPQEPMTPIEGDEDLYEPIEDPVEEYYKKFVLGHFAQVNPDGSFPSMNEDARIFLTKQPNALGTPELQKLQIDLRAISDKNGIFPDPGSTLATFIKKVGARLTV